MSGFHKLRKATDGDIPFICALESAPENIYVHSYSEDVHREKLASTDAHYLIGENEDGETVGYAILFDDGPGRVEWRRIIVSKPGSGIGAPFMDAIIEHYRQQGTKTLWLDVYEDNRRARHVYRGRGFMETGTQPLEEGSKTNLVIMELSLV